MIFRDVISSFFPTLGNNDYHESNWFVLHKKQISNIIKSWWWLFYKRSRSQRYFHTVYTRVSIEWRLSFHHYCALDSIHVEVLLFDWTDNVTTTTHFLHLQKQISPIDSVRPISCPTKGSIEWRWMFCHYCVHSNIQQNVSKCHSIRIRIA